MPAIVETWIGDRNTLELSNSLFEMLANLGGSVSRTIVNDNDLEVTSWVRLL